MTLPAARMGDMHVCPLSTGPVPHVGGPISGPCAPTVLIGGPFAARMGDMAVCVAPAPDVITMGSVNTQIVGALAARQTSACAHGGMVVIGLPTVLIGGPAIVMAGTANAADALLVANEFTKFPLAMQQTLDSGGGKIVVCRGSITEYRTDLRGVRPRGWPAGSTWDTVPGVFNGDRNELVIATTGHGTPAGAHVPATGEGHGSANLVLHEGAHGIDHNAPAGANSSSAGFNAARNSDSGTLSPYESQAGTAGQQETYAESAARYYGGDPNDAAAHPNLHNHWGSNPFAPPPPPPAGP